MERHRIILTIPFKTFKIGSEKLSAANFDLPEDAVDLPEIGC